MPDPDPTPGAGDPPPGQTPPAGDPPAGQPDNDPAKLKSALDAERNARKAAEKTAKEQGDRLAALEKAEAERKAAEMSELEKARAAQEAAEAKAKAADERARIANARTAVTAEAGKLNFHDATTVFVLIADDIEYDADGVPTNVEALVKALAESKPFLVKESGGGAATGPGGVPGTPKHAPPATKPELIEKTRDEMRAMPRYGRI